jgi:hypothetical protein
MKRIIKVLVVSALMLVLMATTVSLAFAEPWWGGGPCETKQGEQEPCGYGTNGAEGWGREGSGCNGRHC